jgi:hypothetical protein
MKLVEHVQYKEDMGISCKILAENENEIGGTCSIQGGYENFVHNIRMRMKLVEHVQYKKDMRISWKILVLAENENEIGETCAIHGGYENFMQNIS